MRTKKAERLQENAGILRAAEEFLYATEYVDASDAAELDGERTFLAALKIFECGHYSCGG
jgi:hypothetical protein